MLSKGKDVTRAMRRMKPFIVVAVVMVADLLVLEPLVRMVPRLGIA